LLAQIIEVLEDIVVPWQKEIKEKRELLSEDPFVGFVALSILGMVFYFFTKQSPSWIGFFLHYLGILMIILGGIAALAAKVFGWGLYRRAAWPTALLVMFIYGCMDTYQISETTETKRAGSVRGADDLLITATRTDEIKRFTGRPLSRDIDTIDQLAGRTVHRTFAQGKLNAVGQKDGHWEVFTLVPKRSAVVDKWYWQDKEVTEEEWKKMSGK
jgi:hypothetical protein